MSDEVIHKYDLIPENASAIQSLLAARSHEIRRENPTLGRSRCHLQAEDEIASTLIFPPITGNELSSWLGTQRNLIHHAKEGEPQREVSFEPVLEDDEPKPTLTIREAHMDTDTFPKSRKPRLEMMDRLVAQMKKIKVGEVWSFPVTVQEDGDYLMRLFSPAVRKLGWRSTGRGSAYKTQRFHDRIKIKRLG